MEFIQIVQRPAYSQRPYGVLRSPYIEHPGCSVLCNHPTAPHSHRALLNVTRASWLQEVRAHMARAGTTQVEGDGDTGDRRTPSSMPFTPLGTEGLQVNIPEEFLARFARSDSRPDSPAPTLLVHTSRLAPFRRCVTPDTLEPVRRPRRPVLRRATSLPACLHDLTATRPQTFPSAPTGRGGGRRKQGRFEADFTTKLSKQLDLVAKGQQQQQQQTQRDQQRQQERKGGRGQRNQLKGQDSEDSGLGGEKKPAKRRPRRGGKKKGEEGGLDDPGQTGVSTVNDSRAGSGRRSGSAHSSKPTSARSSKSSSAHRRLHDPLSYDPKQFLGDSHPPEDGSELAKLQEALGGGPATNLTEAEVFWLSLPRSPSHRAAVFTLPVQMNRLVACGPSRTPTCRYSCGCCYRRGWNRRDWLCCFSPATIARTGALIFGREILRNGPPPPRRPSRGTGRETAKLLQNRRSKHRGTTSNARTKKLYPSRVFCSRTHPLEIKRKLQNNRKCDQAF